ncbi:receptor activity-modifying protein 1 isoform X1 [Cynoglossus semilaevis]|uniref:receptor activity-modifying protein 1 isoform X1 n=1 Tax=Cynoglossus semilaevis TaxID=244447 RepID=UPI0007DC847C|nr:receptor activity-modifying protein 1 isoform X1 [Cynoglossus semilaevis]
MSSNRSMSRTESINAVTPSPFGAFTSKLSAPVWSVDTGCLQQLSLRRQIRPPHPLQHLSLELRWANVQRRLLVGVAQGHISPGGQQLLHHLWKQQEDLTQPGDGLVTPQGSTNHIRASRVKDLVAMVLNHDKGRWELKPIPAAVGECKRFLWSQIGASRCAQHGPRQFQTPQQPQKKKQKTNNPKFSRRAGFHAPV